MDGKPSIDPVKIIFDLGVELLTDQGHTVKAARSLIGKWREGGKRDGDVAAALIDARTRSISNLVEWMPKRLNGGGYGNGAAAGSTLVEQILVDEARRKAAGAPR